MLSSRSRPMWAKAANAKPATTSSSSTSTTLFRPHHVAHPSPSSCRSASSSSSRSSGMLQREMARSRSPHEAGVLRVSSRRGARRTASSASPAEAETRSWRRRRGAEQTKEIEAEVDSRPKIESMWASKRTSDFGIGLGRRVMQPLLPYHHHHHSTIPFMHPPR